MNLNNNAWYESFASEMVVNFQEQPVQTFLKARLTKYLQNQQ